MTKKTYNYNWKEFDSDCIRLVKKVRRYRPKTIVALARGGLPLGVKLSHLLKKQLMIISVKSYNEKKKLTNTVMLNSSYTSPLQSPVLIVDECVDSGTTLKIVADHFKALGVEVKTAVLVYKNQSTIKPDYFIKEIHNETWTVFPWEE